MDDLTSKLRRDAGRIGVEVGPEFDERLRASLERAAIRQPPTEPARKPVASFWWASSLTGIAAAIGLIALINFGRQQSPEPPDLSMADVVEPLEMPLLKARKAVMTTPLHRELDNLESDLRKAENALREDMGIASRDD